MKCTRLIIFLFLPFFNCKGQTTFERTFGSPSLENGYSVQRAFDGGYILSGRTSGFGTGGVATYIVKTYSNGDTAWTKVYRSTGNNQNMFTIQTPDSGYIAV